MLDGLTTSTIAGIGPKLIAGGQSNVKAQSRFLREINRAVTEVTKINTGGLYTPHTLSEAAGVFGVAEGGSILGGTAPTYDLTSVGLRALWKTIPWTGLVERQRDEWLTKIRRGGVENVDVKSMTNDQLIQLATNWAVRDTIYSAFKMYARYENFFALQGVSNSAIGVVTAITAAGVNGVAKFDPATTSSGNRLFDLGAVVEFRDPAGVLRDVSIAAGYMKVNAMVDHNDGVGNVQFANLGADVAVGDTAHFRNLYGQAPCGVPFYVDDTGDFQGTPRANAPHLYESVMFRHANSPAITPMHLREQLQLMRGKIGSYNTPVKVMIWMNGAVKYNLETFIYNTLIRQVGAGKERIADFAIDEFEWDGNEINTDIDVPPDSVYMLNMLSWDKIVQTRLKPLIYNERDLVAQEMGTDGNPLDAKRSTIMSEYNWRCNDPRMNSIYSGYGFNPKFIM